MKKCYEIKIVKKWSINSHFSPVAPHRQRGGELGEHPQGTEPLAPYYDNWERYRGKPGGGEVLSFWRRPSIKTYELFFEKSEAGL